jgi:hypothetical protein
MLTCHGTSARGAVEKMAQLHTRGMLDLMVAMADGDAADHDSI